MPATPSLVGASRGSIECDINVDSMAYWNDPQGEKDMNFKSPFIAKVRLDACLVQAIKCTNSLFQFHQGEEKYISFSVDRGGWNNVRMCKFFDKCLHLKHQASALTIAFIFIFKTQPWK